jgi:putative DNA primase/helicase
MVTGEDALTARFLYGEYFSFKPTFKIFMATNHKPKIRGADNGIWRRIKMIPFTVTIPPEQRDKKLTEKLIAENSGILNWLIQGYAMWRKEGLGKEPDAVRDANNEYRMDMDVVGTFVDDCFDLDTNQEWRLLTKELYDTYIKWCNKNNERIMSQKWLGLRMSEKGFKRLSTNGNRFWLGLILKDTWRYGK